MNQVEGPKRLGAKSGWRIVAGSVTVLMLGILCLLVVVPAVWPITGAQIADVIRAVVGPKPVAMLEGESLAIQDAVNQFVSAQNGGRKTISLAQADTAPIAPKMRRGLAAQLPRLHRVVAS